MQTCNIFLTRILILCRLPDGSNLWHIDVDRALYRQFSIYKHADSLKWYWRRFFCQNLAHSRQWRRVSAVTGRWGGWVEGATAPPWEARWVSGGSLNNWGHALGLCHHYIAAYIKYAGRHFGQPCPLEAKGQLCRRTRHVPTEICKHALMYGLQGMSSS